MRLLGFTPKGELLGMAYNKWQPAQSDPKRPPPNPPNPSRNPSGRPPPSYVARVESSEYKHVVLSLIFLKFVSDKFEERRAELIADGKEKYTDMVEFYTMQNVFYLPETSRWSYIQQHAKQGDIAIKIDSALTAVEKSNASLKGALPDNYFSRLGLDGSKLSALIDAINNIDTVGDKEEDTVGRVYEYFLGKFAASEGKLGGEFYTPKCVVNLIAEMIEPYKGKIYDPCCGSGGMFVQSLKFVESHHGNTKDISVYGQEFTATTYKLAKMNLAVHGLDRRSPRRYLLQGSTPRPQGRLHHGQSALQPEGLARPPTSSSTTDAGTATTPRPPAMPTTPGFSTWSPSSPSTAWPASCWPTARCRPAPRAKATIRQKLVENDLVDCMIALPGQLLLHHPDPRLPVVPEQRQRRRTANAPGLPSTAKAGTLFT